MLRDELYPPRIGHSPAFTWIATHPAFFEYKISFSSILIIERGYMYWIMDTETTHWKSSLHCKNKLAVWFIYNFLRVTKIAAKWLTGRIHLTKWWLTSLGGWSGPVWAWFHHTTQNYVQVKTWIISGIFRMLFLDHCWPQTAENKTTSKRGLLDSQNPVCKPEKLRSTLSIAVTLLRSSPPPALRHSYMATWDISLPSGKPQWLS